MSQRTKRSLRLRLNFVDVEPPTVYTPATPPTTKRQFVAHLQFLDVLGLGAILQLEATETLTYGVPTVETDGVIMPAYWGDGGRWGFFEDG